LVGLRPPNDEKAICETLFDACCQPQPIIPDVVLRLIKLFAREMSLSNRTFPIKPNCCDWRKTAEVLLLDPKKIWRLSLPLRRITYKMACHEIL